MEKKVKRDMPIKEMEERIVRHLGVLLEQIKSEVHTVAEGHGSLRKEIQDTREELGAQIQDVRGELGARIQGVREELGARIQDVRGELGARIQDVRGELGARIQGVREELGAQIQEVRTQIQDTRKEMVQGFNRIENSLGSILQNHEKRITKLEGKVGVS